MSNDKLPLHQYASAALFDLANRNRKNLTLAESMLWERIRNKKLGVKFRRQHPLGKYIVDFYCHEKRLVIEIDGNSHDNIDQKSADLDRTTDILNSGIKEIRFTNNQVETDVEHVIEEIVKVIQAFNDKEIIAPPTRKGENDL